VVVVIVVDLSVHGAVETDVVAVEVVVVVVYAGTHGGETGQLEVMMLVMVIAVVEVRVSVVVSQHVTITGVQSPPPAAPPA